MRLSLLNKIKKSPADIFDSLKENFGEENIVSLTENKIDSIIVINSQSILEVCKFLSMDESFLFDNLICLSGADEEDGEKVKREDSTIDIVGGNLSIYYHLESTSVGHKILLKCLVPRENPSIDSLYNVWRCSDWHEREAYDMFGIIFLSHPNLIRILMPYDWSAGFPLRKDYRNPEFYEGMKVPY